MNAINAPILLIAFNRPDTTQKVFDAIKKAKPKKLYLAVDAARTGFPDDVAKVEAVKEIITKVDWECDVKKKFAEKNQGCGPGPYNAISWVFEKEDRAIILEDDCVPALPFFGYCDELLERYKNDTRIWTISGNNYNEEAVTTPHSYFFSKYGHSWGWATWKRCWQEMDLDMRKWPLLIQQDLFKAAYRTEKESKFFHHKFNSVYKNKTIKTHVWDFQFTFALKCNDGLSIVPRKNLVKNIGFIGTHNSGKHSFHNREVDENYKITSYPDFIICDVNYDAYHFKHHWNSKKDLPRKILKKIEKYLKNKN